MMNREDARAKLKDLDKKFESVDPELHEEVDDGDEVMMDIACDIPEYRKAIKIALEVFETIGAE